MKPFPQLNHHFLIDNFVQAGTHLSRVIKHSQAVLEGTDTLNELQEKDTKSIHQSAQNLRDEIDQLLISGGLDQLASLVLDDILQALIQTGLPNRFVSSLRHELRTPLNSVIGFSQVILQGLDGPTTENQMASFNSIQKNGISALYYLNEVLDISPAQAYLTGNDTLHLEEINLKEIIDNIRFWLKKYLKKEIKENISDNLPAIWGDKVRIHGIIHLTASALSNNFRDDSNILFDAKVNENIITVIIQNDKFPLADTILEKFSSVETVPVSMFEFDPEENTFSIDFDENIVLSFSRFLVKVCGGKIFLNNEEGKGAIATIIFPMEYG